MTLNGQQIVETTQYLPPTDHRGVVVSMARVPVTLAAGTNEFRLQWMAESAGHLLESAVPGRSLIVERQG